MSSFTDFELSQEPLDFVNATPDDEYPLRILRAHRQNCDCRWIAEPQSELADLMNEMDDKRAAILDRAIALLEQAASEQANRPHVCGVNEGE